MRSPIEGSSPLTRSAIGAFGIVDGRGHRTERHLRLVADKLRGRGKVTVSGLWMARRPHGSLVAGPLQGVHLEFHVEDRKCRMLRAVVFYLGQVLFYSGQVLLSPFLLRISSLRPILLRPSSTLANLFWARRVKARRVGGPKGGGPEG